MLSNYSILSYVDNAMTNVLKTVQNTSKLRADLNSGLYKTIGIDWLIKNV